MVELWNRKYMISHFQNHCLFPEGAQHYFNLEATARRCSNFVSKLKTRCVSAVFSWNIQMFGIGENNFKRKTWGIYRFFCSKLTHFNSTYTGGWTVITNQAQAYCLILSWEIVNDVRYHVVDFMYDCTFTICSHND